MLRGQLILLRLVELSTHRGHNAFIIRLQEEAGEEMELNISAGVFRRMTNEREGITTGRYAGARDGPRRKSSIVFPLID